MPTLHDVTDKTKTLLKWGGIVTVTAITLFLVYKGAIFLKQIYFPAPRQAPTVAFGKLPPLAFPKQSVKQKLTYTVDTIDGKLPTYLDEEKKLRDRMKVYRINHNALTLLSLQSARNVAHQAGFIGNGIQIDGNVYRFIRPDTLPKTLDFDIVDKNFTLTSRFPFNEDILKAASVPNQITAVNQTTTLLQALNDFPTDIDTKRTKVQMLKLKNGILFDAQDLTEAQILRVDYFQKNLDTFPIYYPKDVKALIAIAKQHGYDFSLLREVEAINKHMMLSIVQKAEKMLGGSVKGKRIAVLGLSFKPDTDDMRDAPSVVIIKKLAEKGAKIYAYDPIALENAKKLLSGVDVSFAKDVFDCASGADLLILVTEWDEFREIDLQRLKSSMKQPRIVDGRNVYSPQKMKELGFSYVGVGR